MSLGIPATKASPIILIVDHNPATLTVLADSLHQQGFTVLLAQDGETGIERAQLAQPDLMLLEIMLPDIDGFEACRRLKSHPSTHDIPVIFLTTHADDVARKLAGFQAGAVDYIMKPPQEAEVAARVAAHMHLRALTRQLHEQSTELQREVGERKQAEAALQQHSDQIEALVQARTDALRQRVSELTTQLEYALQEMETFTYTISHDLRAPLRAIDGYAHILQEEHLSSTDQEGQRICQVVSNETQRMANLIDDLLTFSRLNRVPMSLARINMSALASMIFSEVTQAEDPSRLVFQLDALPQAYGDPAMIRQVWLNLIANAVKFSSKRERSIIEVGSQSGDGETVYWVRDNGTGFDMQYVDKLFGVFQRLHSERDFPGTGVGLAIIQRVVQRHGGRAWAQGALDQGATFYFSLPQK